MRRLSRVEYDRMIELGFFDDERVELLRGGLITMSPQGARHSGIIRRLTRLLLHAVGERADVSVQAPLAIDEFSQPEPDVALIDRATGDDRHPAMAYLVIEVADSSLRKDRTIKAELYAEASIPEYWIVDTVEDVVEVHTHPEAGVYRRIVRRRRGDDIGLVKFPDISVAAADIL